MRTYYCVCQKYTNRGEVVAGITATTKAKRKPASSFKSTSWADIYCDWFGTRQAAERFAEQAKKA